MSSRLTSDDLRAAALQVLRKEPDPPVRVRLLRDVLFVPANDARLRAAREALERSPHVALLAAEQHEDGGWGRLHSQDTSASQRVPTTEWAVERAVSLGIDRAHPMLHRAAGYLAAVVERHSVPCDPAEKNDRWSTGVQLFAASTLSMIDPHHPALDSVRTVWQEIARRTWSSGSYDPDTEADAHRALTGASVRDSYLVLSNRYALTLLASRPDRLAPELRQAMVRWIWRRPEGIGYLGMPAAEPPQGASSRAVERWFRSHEILAPLSPGAPVGPLVEWLSGRRRGDGLWDLGPRAGHSAFFPLSDTWRRKDARAADWTTRVLVLLNRWITDLGTE